MRASEFLRQAKAMNQVFTKKFPLTVYHGTNENYITAIKENGLKARSYVATSFHAAQSYAFEKVFNGHHYKRDKEEFKNVDMASMPKLFVLTIIIPDNSYLDWSGANAFDVTQKIILPEYFEKITEIDYATVFNNIYKIAPWDMRAKPKKHR
jgi:hypothetical protein